MKPVENSIGLILFALAVLVGKAGEPFLAGLLYFSAIINMIRSFIKRDLTKVEP